MFKCVVEHFKHFPELLINTRLYLIIVMYSLYSVMLVIAVFFTGLCIIIIIIIEVVYV